MESEGTKEKFEKPILKVIPIINGYVTIKGNIYSVREIIESDDPKPVEERILEIPYH